MQCQQNITKRLAPVTINFSYPDVAGCHGLKNSKRFWRLCRGYKLGYAAFDLHNYASFSSLVYFLPRTNKYIVQCLQLCIFSHGQQLLPETAF